MHDAAAREPQNYQTHLEAWLELRSITNGVSPLRDQSHSALVLLLAGTGLLLLMISANVGGLLLARATKREKETAVRFALGASRMQIVHQWLVESLLLASIGSGTGLVFAYASLPLLARWLPPARGIGVDPAELRILSLDLHPDLRVAAFSIGLFAPVIINEAFARRFLSNGDPIGRQFATGKEFVKPEYEVVGVINDANYRSLREIPPPIFYYDGFGPKAYPDAFVLHVRAHGDPRLVIEPIRDVLRLLEPSVPFFQVATLSEEVDRSLWQERLLVALTSCFSSFATALMAIGLYGIVAYFVTARRQEIGLRMALGANSLQLMVLVQILITEQFPDVIELWNNVKRREPPPRFPAPLPISSPAFLY
jgi:hypothetical protein